jgi:1-pyrroline-5-carboxylate dehydrogenase
VFAVSPFNFTAIAGNLTSSVALMGNTVIWKPASTAMLSAHYLMRLFQEAGPSGRRDQPRVRLRRAIGDPALASPDLAGVHFTGSTSVFHDMWKTIGANIDTYRNYPRIVGETGGKDFIVAHPSADVDALATAIVRGSFEYQGQKCSAASRIYAPSNLWPKLRTRLQEEVGSIRMGDVSDFGTSWVRSSTSRRSRRRSRRSRTRSGTRGRRSSSAAAPTTPRGTSSSRR